MEKNELKRGSSQVWLGAFFLVVGIGLILPRLNTDLPSWLFSWKTFLIVFGLFLAIRHQFKGGPWYVMILIGGVFLLQDIYPAIRISQFTWPVIIIIVGLWFIFRPKGYRRWGSEESTQPGITQAAGSAEDYIDSTSIFGGVRRTILSKDFKGGEVVSFLGGTELNLSQADINGVVILDVTQVMGGTKIIVPSHWDIKSELVTVFGGIEDKRNVQTTALQPNKVLVLKGTSVFGGIDIRSY